MFYALSAQQVALEDVPKCMRDQSVKEPIWTGEEYFITLLCPA
jgi:hypothetical protein